jgi:hypothetical protein
MVGEGLTVTVTVKKLPVRALVQPVGGNVVAESITVYTTGGGETTVLGGVYVLPMATTPPVAELYHTGVEPTAGITFNVVGVTP